MSMKLILTVVLSTLMLNGCVANWPSHRTGSRWVGGPNLLPFYDQNPGQRPADSSPPPPPPSPSR